MIGIDRYQQLYGVDRGLKYNSFRIPSQESRVCLLTARGESNGTTRGFVRVGRVNSENGETAFFIPQGLTSESELFANFSVTQISEEGDVQAVDTRFFDLWMPVGVFQNNRRQVKNNV